MTFTFHRPDHFDHFGHFETRPDHDYYEDDDDNDDFDDDDFRPLQNLANDSITGSDMPSALGLVMIVSSVFVAVLYRYCNLNENHSLPVR